MFSLLKTLNNRYSYIYIIIILFAVYSLLRASVPAVSGINFVIIIYLLILNNITEDSYIIYSIIFGLFSDFILGSYIGLSVLFFLFISIIKMITEEKVDLYSYFSNNVFALVIIFIYNIFYVSILGYPIFTDYLYIIGKVFFDYIFYFISFYILEYLNAFRRIKR